MPYSHWCVRRVRSQSDGALGFSFRRGKRKKTS
jgi:hypothetical protein